MGLEAWAPSVDGLQIAIDGPSGSGKGSVAVALAQHLDLPVVDSGILYRYIAYQAMQQEREFDHKDLNKWISCATWKCGRIFFEGRNILDLLRTEGVGARASELAAMQSVRDALLDWQRDLAKRGAVMDGRDIGSVILPGAHAKFYLDASLDVRADRRWRQLQKLGRRASLDETRVQISLRDERDCSRAIAPLIKAPEAIEIDSSYLDLESVVALMLKHLSEKKLVHGL